LGKASRDYNIDRNTAAIASGSDPYGYLLLSPDFFLSRWRLVLGGGLLDPVRAKVPAVGLRHSFGPSASPLEAQISVFSYRFTRDADTTAIQTLHILIQD
jgi:hypothetical protein